MSQDSRESTFEKRPDVILVKRTAETRGTFMDARFKHSVCPRKIDPADWQT